MNFGVVVFPGTWSDCDFHYVIGEVLHQPVRYVWHRDANLADFDCLILPGGFSYGDYLRAGAVAGRSPVVEALPEFAARGGLVLGSCNGFQILCEARLLPGALRLNKTLRYLCQDVHLRCENDSTPWTAGYARGEIIRMPIGHGEGNYTASSEELARLRRENRVVFRYCEPDGRESEASNPNGSDEAIAGVCNAAGNVVGLMPHPDRCSEAIVGNAAGIAMFQSCIDWVRTGSLAVSAAR